MTFRGGKMAVVLTALSTAGGALWGGFEFYKDYVDMKEVVQNIDIDKIKAENALVQTKLDGAIDYTRDIKDGLRDDLLKLEQAVDRMEDKVDESENRVKDAQDNIEQTLEGIRTEMNQVQKDVTASIREVEKTIRESEKDVRDTMRETETRIDTDMRQLDKDIKEVLQEALDNPLNN